MRIPVLEFDRYEADDVIGTLATRCASDSLDVVIVSSDKDMLQLVNDRVSMYNPMKEDVWYDEAATEAFMGVKPSQVADLLALKGDAIDNIPGAPGIGDKGAKDLIVRFGSVEAALDRAAEVGAQDVSREPAEQSRPHPHEQEAGHHRARRSGGVLAVRRPGPGSPTSTRSRPSTRRWSFFSLLEGPRPY